MEALLKNLHQELLQKTIAFLESHIVIKDLFLYYIKGIEDGPRIERRMLKVQNEFESWCKRKGIALVVLKGAENNVTLSFVPERQWEHDKAIYESQMKEIGDKIE